MRKQLSRIGNSLALFLSRDVLALLGAEPSEDERPEVELEVRTEDGTPRLIVWMADGSRGKAVPRKRAERKDPAPVQGPPPQERAAPRTPTCPRCKSSVAVENGRCLRCGVPVEQKGENR